MLPRKKQTYCSHMYIGFNGHHTDFSICCDITYKDCNAYEEMTRRVEDEITGEERVKNRHWTNEKTWRLNLYTIQNCPSNKKRDLISLMESQEKKVEEEFFAAGETLSGAR